MDNEQLGSGDDVINQNDPNQMQMQMQQPGQDMDGDALGQSGGDDDGEEDDGEDNDGQMQDQQQMQPMDAEQEYAQMDYRICGELIERNKALDEFAMSQDANGVI